MKYLNILQFSKTVVDITGVLSRNGFKSIFYECDKKIINHFAKSFSVLKKAKISPLNTLKTFFLAKCFISQNY